MKIIQVQDAYEKLKDNEAILIDVREKVEIDLGTPQLAIHIPLEHLEKDIIKYTSDTSKNLFLICASGIRSLKGCTVLKELGYKNVFSLKGGFKEWKQYNLPCAIEYNEGIERYKRQIIIDNIGVEGQNMLLKSKILLVGCGGLGSPAALYLAAAGIGTIGIIDDDIVDISNLHRQILYNEKNIGQSKVKMAKERLVELNSDIDINIFNEKITNDNVESIIKEFDIVLDGTDNFNTRYLINDACVKLKKPNIHGSVFQYEGQITVFWPHSKENSPCYRCLYPAPPPKEFSASCAEAGVIGVLPGVIGSLCAAEAIKIILGVGEPLIGKLLIYDLLNVDFLKLQIHKNKDCIYCNCENEENYPEYSNYVESCDIN